MDGRQNWTCIGTEYLRAGTTGSEVIIEIPLAALKARVGRVRYACGGHVGRGDWRFVTRRKKVDYAGRVATCLEARASRPPGQLSHQARLLPALRGLIL